MEIEVMEQFINSDCYTWKTSLLFTAYNKKYLELHNECTAVTINNNNKKNLSKLAFGLIIFSMAAGESASKS